MKSVQWLPRCIHVDVGRPTSVPSWRVELGILGVGTAERWKIRPTRQVRSIGRYHIDRMQPKNGCDRPNTCGESTINVLGGQHRYRRGGRCPARIERIFLGTRRVKSALRDGANLCPIVRALYGEELFTLPECCRVSQLFARLHGTPKNDLPKC